MATTSFNVPLGSINLAPTASGPSFNFAKLAPSQYACAYLTTSPSNVVVRRFDVDETGNTSPVLYTPQVLSSVDSNVRIMVYAVSATRFIIMYGKSTVSATTMYYRVIDIVDNNTFNAGPERSFTPVTGLSFLSVLDFIKIDNNSFLMGAWKADGTYDSRIITIIGTNYSDITLSAAPSIGNSVSTNVGPTVSPVYNINPTFNTWRWIPFPNSSTLLYRKVVISGATRIQFFDKSAPGTIKSINTLTGFPTTVDANYTQFRNFEFLSSTRAIRMVTDNSFQYIDFPSPIDPNQTSITNGVISQVLTVGNSTPLSGAERAITPIDNNNFWYGGMGGLAYNHNSGTTGSNVEKNIYSLRSYRIIDSLNASAANQFNIISSALSQPSIVASGVYTNVMIPGVPEYDVISPNKFIIARFSSSPLGLVGNLVFTVVDKPA